MKKLLTFLTMALLFYGVGWAETVTGSITFGTPATKINAASVTGVDTQGNTWTITTAGTTSFTQQPTYSQVGSGSKPATSITFTTTLPEDVTITAMSAMFGGFSGTAGNVTLMVGSESVGSGRLNGTTDVTIASNTNTNVTGRVLTVTVTDISKGVKCYNISYTYTTSSPSPSGTTYNLVTSELQIAAGNKYILADANGKVLSAINTSHVGTTVDGTVSGSNITVEDAMELTLEKYSDSWVFKTASGKYVSAESSGIFDNNTNAINGAMQTLSVDATGVATLKFAGGYYITFNGTNFIAKTSQSNSVYLYGAADNVTLERPATPIFSPSGGEVVSGTEVTISCTTDGVEIAYSTNGGANWTGYTTPIAITEATTLQAKAIKDGISSEVATATYTIFTPATVTPTYTENFSDGFGDFYIENQTNPGFDVWTTGTYQGTTYAKAAAYKNSSNHASASMLISPYINLANTTNPKFSFSQAIDSHFGTIANEATVWVKESNASTWTQITIDYPDIPSSGYTSFESQTISLSAYKDKTIQIAFKYVSTTSNAGNWEVANFKVEDIGAYNIYRTIKTNGNSDNEAGGWFGNWSSNCSTPDGVSGNHYTVKATAGETVQFKVGTNSGYQILQQNVTAVDGSGNNITLTKVSSDNSGIVFLFTMPVNTVTITADFNTYHGTLRLAGHFNGNSTWRSGNEGPEFTYDSANDKYTIRAYFTGVDDGGANDYFCLTLDGVEKHPQADQGNYYIYDLNGGAMPFNLSGGSNNNFGCAPGVYDIEINGSLTSMKFTKVDPTITITPAAGEVEQGTTVNATSTLTSMIAAIKANDSGAAGEVTVGVNTDNGNTWNENVTLNTVGSTTVYGKAFIGNIAVTGNAAYTVVGVNNSKRYQLITSTNDLVAGKKYIIVSQGSYTSSSVTYNFTKAAASPNQANNLILDADVTISNNIVDLSEISGVTEFTLGGSTGAWTFAFGDGTYLASSAAKSAKADETATPAAISFSGNNATIEMNTTVGSFQYNPNSGNGRFAAYTSTQKPVMLFKQMVEEVKDYTIDYAVVTGGSATGAASANEGEEITVTVTAESGYACTGITVSPAAEVTDNGDGTYTFTMPASNVTVTPAFASAYAITYVATPAAGGTVTGVANAVEGSTVVINVTANDDYQIESVKYSWGSQQSSVDVPFVNGNYQITMPGSATTVTATFVKIPHGISVVSSHGDVTGLPATATSGTSVTFTVTPNAGYVVSSVSGTFNNGSGSLNITDNGNGTYTFNMPASDVAITVTYFASEDYELLTDLADINAEDTYLIVGGAVSALGTYDKVMGKSTGSGIMGTVDLTSSNYDSTTGIITSTADMAVVNFLVDDGTYAIHTADGYVNESSVTASTPFYWTIDLDATSSRAQITSTNKHFSYNSSSPRWKAYDSEQGASYIFKLANKNKVKRPTITGAAGEFLGQYNFIGKDNVTLGCATEDAVIEYSLDGGTTWLNYSEAVEIVTNAAGNTVEVQARATKTGMDPSEVVTATFTCIKPTAPTFGSNGPDAYENPVFVYPKSALNDRRAYGEENVSFAYTTTGTVADATSPAVTTKNSNSYYILLDDNATLSVVTMINGIASDAAGGAYTFSVDAPTFSLAGGNYDGNQQTRLSTETKTQQNNLSWNTVIYYTTGNTEFAFDATTGQVTSEGWEAYDATNDPYLDILVQDSPVTIKAVTLSNYFNGQSEYRASEVTSETYVLTAANLAITISPAAGTYVNAQNVTLGVKNEIGEYTIYYTTDGTAASTGSTVYDGTAITVDHDMTIKVYAVDSRAVEGGTATAEAAYKIGIQPVVYSPFPGTIYKGDDEDINVEMFSVTPNAKVYYTVAEGEGNWPADPTTASTLYSAPVPLETGKVYNFKAISALGSMVSTVTPGTFTIQAKGSGWLNVKEMNEETGNAYKYFDNPVQVVYMSTWRANGEKPEFCFVRDNSGYGMIYFGNSNVEKYNDYTKYQMGDWLPGGSIKGQASVWDNSFINELGNSSGTVSEWPETALGNSAILPEETTNKAITDGWTYEGAYSGSDYAQYVNPEKNLFGHYVHMRKNTISNLSLVSQKYLGVITDQSGVPLNYYDGLYLFSGHNGRPTYDQAFFDNIQNNGGTFDVYAIVYFYGSNANNSNYSNAPFEIFPIDFEWIYKPKFNIESGEYDKPQTVSLTCETEGAQIWYKTSEMDDYVLYTEPFTVSTTTTIDAYSTIVTKYNDVMESVIETINVRFATHVSPPFITPDGGVYAVTDPAIDVTIIRFPELDDASVMQSDVNIWFTVDGSDPADKNNPNRYKYTTENKEEHLDEIHTTTTVRAISEYLGVYSEEATSQTYTFVESNGIIYNLVTSVDQINEKGIYVIVAQPGHEAMSNVQGATTRGTTGVKFVDEDMKTKVYGNQDVAVFTVTPLTNMDANGSGEKHFLFTTHNGATLASNGILYVDETAAANGNTLLTEAEEDAMGNSVAVVTIDSDEGEQSHKARIRFNYAGGDNRYLQYWNRDHYFTTYKTQDDERAVYLYYKEATPLATIEKEGVKNQQYTVADRLLVVAANNTEHVIWAKDEGNVSIARTEIKNGQIDYMRYVAENDISSAQDAGVLFQKGDWDQSNWVMIKLLESDENYNSPSKYEGSYILPASLTGRYTDDLNYTIEAMSSLKDIVDATGGDFTPNVYCAANFLDANLNLTAESQGAPELPDGDRHFFFVNPKVQEVATITYAVWDGTKFVMPARNDAGTINGAGLTGAFNVGWTYNGSTPTLETGVAYQFTAVLNKVAQQGNAPRRAESTVEPGAFSADAGKVVYPLDLTADESHIVTEVRDLTGNAVREVVSVKYVSITGVVSDKPFEGMNIIVTRYTDGTTSTAKVMR